MIPTLVCLCLILQGLGSALAVTASETTEEKANKWPGQQFSVDDLSHGGYEDADSGPSFDPSTTRNVTVLVGRTAHLHCRVRHLGNRTVSWVRHRDVHILTVGRYTYTSDQRFSIARTRQLDDWTLQIKYSQARDAGLYECQVSTQPHRSLFVQLNVVDDDPVGDDGHVTWSLMPGKNKDKPSRSRGFMPRAVILGGPDFHVDVGSHVNLTCIVQYSPEPPAYIFWYHQDQVLTHDSPRGGVAIITDKTSSITTSSLLLRQVRHTDSGKYSCTPSNADPASVSIHVLRGEHPAAMQSNAASSLFSSHPPTTYVQAVFLFFHVCYFTPVFSVLTKPFPLVSV